MMAKAKGSEKPKSVLVRKNEASHAVRLEVREESCKFRFSIHDFRLCERNVKSEEREEFVSPTFITGLSDTERAEWRMKVSLKREDDIVTTVDCEIEDISESKSYVDTTIVFYFVAANGSLEKIPEGEAYDYGKLVEKGDTLLPNGVLNVLCLLRIFYPTAAVPCGMRSNRRLGPEGGILWKLQSDFQRLYEDPKNPDVVLQCGDHQFNTHKGILSARSMVFEKMFEHDTKENQENVVLIEDSTPEAIRVMLQYVYCGEIDEQSTQVMLQLYSLAEKYDLEELRRLCSNYVASNLGVVNLCEAAILAHLCDDKDLLAATKTFFNFRMRNIVTLGAWTSLVSQYPALAEHFVKP